MVNSELVENIKSRFQQGEKAAEIKDVLFNEGWTEGDLDAAFSHIRHEALMQISIYAKIHGWLQSADQKTAQLPTRKLVQIFIAIGLVFLGGVMVLYYFLDPLGVRTAERDQNREKAAIELRLSLEKYSKDHNARYPSSTKQLVPTYLPVEPIDPKSKQPYTYKTLEQGKNYEFCIEFEMQTIRCVSADDTSSIPDAPEVAVPTPIQSAQFAINGQIFFDLNKNGKKDDVEDTTGGTAVRIADPSNNTILCDTLTDSAGIFSCNLKGEGQYIVSFTVLPGYTSKLGNPINVTLPNPKNLQPTIETLFIGLVK